MPADGYLEVAHRRLRPKRGIEYLVSKGNNNWDDFNNGVMTGNPDMSTFWTMSSHDPPKGTGIFRWGNPYHDYQWVYEETWVSHNVSTDGLLGSDVIPALPATPDNYLYVACPTYVPTTNELWWIATALGVADGQPGVGSDYACILKGDADSPAANSTLVFSEEMVSYSNILSGGNRGWCCLRLEYDHVRDCVWVFISNNDVTFAGDGSHTVSNARNGGYVALRKYSTGGMMLSEEVFNTWTGLLWGDDDPQTWHGLNQFFTVGNDGLLWCTTTTNLSGTALPVDDVGNGRYLLSYNPETSTHTLYSDALPSVTQMPGFMPDGRLLMTRRHGAFNTLTHFVLFDPGGAEEELLEAEIVDGQAGSGGELSRFWTSPDRDKEFPDIFVIQRQSSGSSGSVWQFKPGYYGLTVTSADIEFDKPWETTDTPIWDTDDGVTYTSTYGPFREGDHIRFGLLLEKEAAGQTTPAAADLAITTARTFFMPLVVNGEGLNAYWVWPDGGDITINWCSWNDGLRYYGAAETVISLDADAAVGVEPPAEILDNIVRIIAVEEVVPITAVHEPLEASGEGDGCPDDTIGFSFFDTVPIVAGSDESGPYE